MTEVSPRYFCRVAPRSSDRWPSGLCSSSSSLIARLLVDPVSCTLNTDALCPCPATRCIMGAGIGVRNDDARGQGPSHGDHKQRDEMTHTYILGGSCTRLRCSGPPGTPSRPSTIETIETIETIALPLLFGGIPPEDPDGRCNHATSTSASTFFYFFPYFHLIHFFTSFHQSTSITLILNLNLNRTSASSACEMMCEGHEGNAANKGGEYANRVRSGDGDAKGMGVRDGDGNG